MNSPANNEPPVALITGAAQRIGAQICRQLHQAGYNIIIHYRHSKEAASALQQELNSKRSHSAFCLSADLNQGADILQLAEQALYCFHRIDLLVNNASSFYRTAIGEVTDKDWDDLFASNAKAPLMLSQALAPELAQRQGAIINIVDIHADRPLKNYTVYCMAKAALAMLTKSLAKELAPKVRVNGVSPGAILWPEAHIAEANEDWVSKEQQHILDRVPMQRSGGPEDIARTVQFLAIEAPYITGQIIAVDGGRTLSN